MCLCFVCLGQEVTCLALSAFAFMVSSNELLQPSASCGPVVGLEAGMGSGSVLLARVLHRRCGSFLLCGVSGLKVCDCPIFI